METVYREAVWNLMGTHRQALENNWKMDQVSKYLEGEILVMPLPGDEKWLRALFPMEGLANALVMQQKLSAETFRAYRKDLSPLLEEGKISVKVIQKMARAYMEAWFKIHHPPVWVNGKPFYGYSKIEVQRLADLATALYLESWLCQDETNFQTPYNMYVRPYEKLGKRENTGFDCLESSHMKRRIKKAKIMDRARMAVSEQTMRIPGQGPYRKGIRGNNCDLVTAARVLAEKEDKLEIISMLIEKKYVLTTAEERRVQKYNSIEDACLRYQELITEADGLNTGRTDDLLKKKQFVATSMLLHRIERECRFHYHARCIRRMMDGTIDVSKFDRETWNVFFASQKGFAGQTTADKQTLPWVNEDFSVGLPRYDPINDAGDVLNIDRYIDAVYRVNDGMSEAGRAHFALFDRAALLDMVRVLMAAFPPKDQHPWGEEEFYQAARFYREDYPVVAELVKIRFPSSKKGSADYMLPGDLYRFYRGFVECYQNLEQTENSQLAMMRKAYGAVK